MMKTAYLDELSRLKISNDNLMSEMNRLAQQRIEVAHQLQVMQNSLNNSPKRKLRGESVTFED